MTLPTTPSQTVGPYYALGLCVSVQNELVPAGTEGAFVLEGRVLDGDGVPVNDAMVEIWQADESGTYRGDFGWARCGTDTEGRYSFVTCKPGPVGGQAPHLEMLVFMRGLLKPVLTRVYFPDEKEANAADPVLGGAREGDRETLVAEATHTGLRFDVRLQGDRQTVFFVLAPR
jgi:protocatechuate 3,4-dioxygenase alpha subunit